MARVKRGVPAHAKHKKVLKKAKGYYGRRKDMFRQELLYGLKMLEEGHVKASG